MATMASRAGSQLSLRSEQVRITTSSTRESTFFSNPCPSLTLQSGLGMTREPAQDGGDLADGEAEEVHLHPLMRAARATELQAKSEMYLTVPASSWAGGGGGQVQEDRSGSNKRLQELQQQRKLSRQQQQQPRASTLELSPVLEVSTDGTEVPRARDPWRDVENRLGKLYSVCEIARHLFSAAKKSVLCESRLFPACVEASLPLIYSPLFFPVLMCTSP